MSLSYFQFQGLGIVHDSLLELTGSPECKEELLTRTSQHLEEGQRRTLEDCTGSYLKVVDNDDDDDDDEEEELAKCTDLQ